MIDDRQRPDAADALHAVGKSTRLKSNEIESHAHASLSTF